MCFAGRCPEECPASGGPRTPAPERLTHTWTAQPGAGHTEEHPGCPSRQQRQLAWPREQNQGRWTGQQLLHRPGSRFPTCSCPPSPGSGAGTSQDEQIPAAAASGTGGQTLHLPLCPPLLSVSAPVFLQDILLLPSADGPVPSSWVLCSPLPKGGLVTSQTLSQGSQLLNGEIHGPKQQELTHPDRVHGAKLTISPWYRTPGAPWSLAHVWPATQPSLLACELTWYPS